MTQFQRKWLYAISYEVIGLILSAAILALTFESSATLGLTISAIMATQALLWNVIYNTLFEAWERRQPVKGRSTLRRCVHAVLFDIGLTILTVPVLMFFLDAPFWQALVVDLGLTACYMVYTYIFTWGFDRIFGLPQSAQ